MDIIKAWSLAGWVPPPFAIIIFAVLAIVGAVLISKAHEKSGREDSTPAFSVVIRSALYLLFLGIHIYAFFFQETPPNLW